MFCRCCCCCCRCCLPESYHFSAVFTFLTFNARSVRSNCLKVFLFKCIFSILVIVIFEFRWGRGIQLEVKNSLLLFYSFLLWSCLNLLFAICLRSHPSTILLFPFFPFQCPSEGYNTVSLYAIPGHVILHGVLLDHLLLGRTLYMWRPNWVYQSPVEHRCTVLLKHNGVSLMAFTWWSCHGDQNTPAGYPSPSSTQHLRLATRPWLQ